MNRPLDGVIVFEDPADVIHGKPVNRIPTPFAVAPADVVISAPTATPTGPPAPEAPPTAWPTRMPVPLAGVTVAAHAPTEAPVPPTPTAIWPPPKTPIITTPTVVATAGPTLPVLTPTEPSGVAAETPSATPTEVALGRAGGGLLEEAGAQTVPPRPALRRPQQESSRPQAAKSARSRQPHVLRWAAPRAGPHADPRHGLYAHPTATPTPNPWLLDRILARADRPGPIDVCDEVLRGRDACARPPSPLPRPRRSGCFSAGDLGGRD